VMSLTQSQLSELRRMLLQDKAEWERHLALESHFGLNDSERVQSGELSAYDNHPADLGTETYERGKDIALNENAEHHLREIDEALERMNQDRYGTCSACGREIPFERLEAVPTALYCVEHVPDPNVSERRPIEERLLEPPFGRTSLDELPEQNQFDGEDAWQIVESWGSSNSPAMAEDRQVDDYNEMAIEADENDGYVEPFESFLATDLYGENVTVVRNRKYREYMHNNEGEPLLEPDSYEDPLQ
jgi:YteA family regulatory protein